MNTAKQAYRFCSSFEAELLLELMLRFWRHPLADNRDFRNALIESATEALRASLDGEQLIQSVPPAQMNFVAAVWYVEWVSLQAADRDLAVEERDLREAWLSRVRQAIPSCFCDQTDLSG
jgi:hypothetical protein